MLDDGEHRPTPNSCLEIVCRPQRQPFHMPIGAVNWIDIGNTSFIRRRESVTMYMREGVQLSTASGGCGVDAQIAAA